MKDGEPYICVQDICAEIGLQDTQVVLQRLRKTDVFSKHPGIIAAINTETDTGVRAMAYVNELGLYEIIGNSRKPRARELHRQIIMALPALRRDGNRIAELEDRITKLEAGGKHLLTTIPEISLRSQLNMTIRKFVARQTTGYSYEDAWNELYYQFKYRYHRDLKAGARNRKCDVLDYAEKEGLTPDMLNLASHIFAEAR
jgi:prophage antirepressor-like protein